MRSRFSGRHRTFLEGAIFDAPDTRLKYFGHETLNSDPVVGNKKILVYPFAAPKMAFDREEYQPATEDWLFGRSYARWNHVDLPLTFSFWSLTLARALFEGRRETLAFFCGELGCGCVISPAGKRSVFIFTNFYRRTRDSRSLPNGLGTAKMPFSINSNRTFSSDIDELFI
jgi:hypothetical protein